VKITEHLILPGILLVAVVIRLIGVDVNPVNLDEAFTLFNVQYGFGPLTTIILEGDNPILHYYFVKTIVLITQSTDSYFPRLLSVLFSIGTVYVSFRISKSWMGLLPAILVSGLILFNTQHQYFSHEIRPYSMFIFLSVLLLWDSQRILKGGISGRFFLHGLLYTALIYTHYLGLIVSAADLILLLVAFKESKRIGRFLPGLIVSAVLLSPLALAFIGRLKSYSTGNSWVPNVNFSALKGVPVYFLNEKWVVLLIVVLFAVVFYLLIRKRIGYLKELKSDRFFVHVLLFLAAIFFLMLFISIRGNSVFIIRYLLFLSIPFYLLLGKVLGLLEMRIQTAVSGVIVLAVVLSFNIKPEFERSPREIAQYVKEYKVEYPTVVLFPGYYDINLLYYYDRKAFERPEEKDEYLAKNSILAYYTSNEVINRVFRMNKFQWVVANPGDAESNNKIREALKRTHNLVKEETFKGDFAVLHYRKKEEN
jgi:hypothetical protein